MKNSNALKFFDKKVDQGRIPAEILAKIERGELQAKDYALYVNKKISGSSNIVQLITDSLDATPGITNINKGRLPENNLFIVTGIRVGYAVATTASSPVAAGVNYKFAKGSDFPAVLGNCELQIDQGNGRIITQTLNDIFSEAASEKSGFELGMALENFELLKPASKISYNVQVPEGLSVTVASNEVFLSVALTGVYLQDAPGQ